ENRRASGGSGADRQAPAGGLVAHTIAELGREAQRPFGLTRAMPGEATRRRHQRPLAQRKGGAATANEVGPDADEAAPEEADVVADGRVGGDGAPGHPPAPREERSDRRGLEGSRQGNRQRED